MLTAQVRQKFLPLKVSDKALSVIYKSRLKTKKSTLLLNKSGLSFSPVSVVPGSRKRTMNPM